MQAGCAQHLHGQEIGQQRAVEDIDAGGAGHDIGTALAVELIAGVGGDRQFRTCAEDIGQRHDVAKAEVQSLRADRRKDVRGFADQRRAALAGTMRHHAGQRPDLNAILDGHLAEQRLHALLDDIAQFGKRQFAAGLRRQTGSGPRRGWSD
jgi:hypothetical protein